MPTFEVGLSDGRTIHIDADDFDAAMAGAQHFLTHNPPNAQGNNQSNAPQSIYTVQAPDGHQLDIQAPDQETALRGAQQWHAAQQKAGSKPLMFDDLQDEGPPKKITKPVMFDDLVDEGPPSTWKDIATQGAKGVAEIPENIVSAVPRGFDALGKGIQWASHKIAPDSQWTKNNDAAEAQRDALGKQIDAIRPNVSDYFPAAQTGWGEAARTLGNFGIGALAPGSVLRRLWSVVAPAAASEGAGRFADAVAPDYGTAARIGGALLGGGVAVKGRAPEVSLADAKAATNASYDAARNAGVTYDAQALASAAAAKKAALNKIGISEKSAPSAHDTLDSFINNTAPMSLKDLEEQRQLISGDLSKGGKEAKAAGAVRDVIDDIMSNPQKNAVSWSTGNPAEAYSTLQRARTQALATNRLQDIEKLQHDANVTSNVHGTEANKALKMQFGSALKSESTMRGFNDPDLAGQMENISAGSFPQGIAKKLGGGNLSHWSVPELAALAFPVTMPAVLAMRGAGLGLSKVVDAKTLAKVAKLKATIAQKGGLPYTPGTNPWPLRALIGASAGNSNGGQ